MLGYKVLVRLAGVSLLTKVSPKLLVQMGLTITKWFRKDNSMILTISLLPIHFNDRIILNN